MTFSVTPTGAVARLLAATLGRFLTGTMRKALVQDLEEIAVAAEQRG